MYWARYVLMDQELRGGGMRSTKCPSSLQLLLYGGGHLSNQDIAVLHFQLIF